MSNVTVLMSVYNGMPYLPKAVDSILAQTFEDWKFVIVNDGSTDGSAKYLESLKDPRIQVVTQENQGLAAALNNGLQHCDTTYVARLDSDDISLPNRLEEQVKYLDEHPEVGMLGSQFLRMGPERCGFASSLPCDHTAIHKALLEARHAVCHPTIMCKTEVMKQIGGYWKHPVAQDWDLYLKMCENTQVANLDKVLLKYRVHTGSLNGKYLARIRRNQRFAAEIARRRTHNEPEIELEDFDDLEKKKSLSWRWQEKLNVFAMYQYRRALQKCLSNKWSEGYMRLGFAAVCSPRLAFQRIRRILDHKQPMTAQPALSIRAGSVKE